MNTPTTHSPIILAFGAQAGVGKDRACFIVRQLLPGAERIGFADELKSDLVARFPGQIAKLILSRDRADKQVVRPLLVGWGMTARNLDPDYWIKRTFVKIARLPNSCPLVAISDARFCNEIEVIKARGGVYVHIDNPFVPPANEEEALHAPRCAELADYRIENAYDPTTRQEVVPGHFYRAVHAVVSQALARRGVALDDLRSSGLATFKTNTPGFQITSDAPDPILVE